MPLNLPKLSDSEWEVMKPLWEKGDLAARDIYQEVAKENTWAYKTVKTMLARLVKKGALTYEQIGNSYLYHAAYSREEITQSATNSFINRVFDGGVQPFLAHFVDHVSPEELAVLQSELRRLERQRGSREEE